MKAAPEWHIAGVTADHRLQGLEEGLLHCKSILTAPWFRLVQAQSPSAFSLMLLKV